MGRKMQKQWVSRCGKIEPSATFSIIDRGTAFRIGEEKQGTLSEPRRPAFNERLFIFLVVKIVFFTADGPGGENGQDFAVTA